MPKNTFFPDFGRKNGAGAREAGTSARGDGDPGEEEADHQVDGGHDKHIQPVNVLK